MNLIKSHSAAKFKKLHKQVNEAPLLLVRYCALIRL